MIAFLAKLSDHNIYVDLKDDKLKLYFESDAIDPVLLNEIKERKEEIIAHLRDYQVTHTSSQERKIGRVTKSDGYPLSAAQKRLWVLSQMEEGSAAYNVPSRITLTGSFTIGLLEKAILATIERHEILRTVFREDSKGEIKQWILKSDEINFKLNHQDVSKQKDALAIIDTYINEDSYKVFNLATGPLLRASLFTVAPDRHIFYYNMHHIISDGWSMDILSRDVLAYYKSYESGASLELPTLEIQYKDYASWQLSKMDQDENFELKNYWTQQLSGELLPINLPFQKQRPKIKTHNGDSLQSHISKKLTASLKQFISEHKGSLFTGILAFWNVMLHKYTSLEDIVVGTSVAGRDHSDLTDQIGFYVNPVVLRNEVDPSDSFSSLFQKIHTETLTSFNHQSYPFDRLVEDLNIPRDLSRNPVFDVMLVLQNAGEAYEKQEEPIDEQQVDAIVLIKNTKSKFDLQITFNEVGDYLSFYLTYNTDVYERSMIEGMIVHFKQLLGAALSNPETPIGTLDYLSVEEKTQLLTGFNTLEIDYPREATLVSLFEAQAKAHPLSVAVVFEGTQLTYAELEAQANQLSHYLKQNHQIQPEDLIAISLERGPWLVVALLGVLKAGGAYVPIDPNYPQSRIDYIVADSQCKVCIDTHWYDRFRTQQSDYSTQPLKTLIAPQHLAYVIYTSGTTGNPKGVLVEHRNVVRLFFNDEALFDFTSEDVWCLFHSYCFDFSVWELFGALLYGGKLVVISNLTARDTKLFSKTLAEEGVTVLNQTPSAFKFLQAEVLNTKLDLAVRYVIFGGEALSPHLLKGWKQGFPECKLINMYGITETTVHVTYKEITQVDIDENKSNIGSAIPTMECYVLNEQLQLVPIGVSAQLYVSGDGVARGYLNRARLTEQRFIEHPYQKGKRLYQTGDVARWLPDGNLEYLGRADQQVKIRGHRIELGEIEFQLLQHSSIAEVIVVANSTEDGEQSLVAYVVLLEDETASGLRKFLSNRVPDYMLPSYFVPLEKMPLTPNGKVDKKGLPNVHGAELTTGTAYQAPYNKVQKELVLIWEQLLNREKIGIQDNFFELGGHSIKAVSLITSMHKAFGVKLELKDIFLSATIEELSELIDTSKTEAYVEITPVPISDSYEVSYEQKRLWLLSQDAHVSRSYHMYFLLELEERIDFDNFEKAIWATIERHEILRTVFKENDRGTLHQWILPMEGFNFSIDRVDFRHETDPTKVSQYIEERSFIPFNLESGPIISAAFLQLADNRTALFYNMHHIISDGLSLQILSKDVLQFYNSFIEENPIEIAPLRVQYKDYVAWQHDILKGDKLAEQHKFWQQTFEAGIPRVRLPFEKNRPEVYSYLGNSMQFSLSSNLRKGFESIATSFKGSMYITTLFFVKILFQKYVGDQQIMIGSSFSTRTHKELENQIGFYVNNLPVVSKVEGHSLLKNLYENIRDRVLTVSSNPWYPLELLIDQANYVYDSSFSGLFNVLVEYHENDASKLEVTDANLAQETTLYRDNIPCQMDLSLEFSENNQGGLNCVLLYNNSLYDRTQMELFKTRLLFLAEELVAAVSQFDQKTVADINFENNTQPNNEYQLFSEENF